MDTQKFANKINCESGARKINLRDAIENYKLHIINKFTKIKFDNQDKIQVLECVEIMINHLLQQNGILLKMLEERDSELRNPIPVKNSLSLGVLNNSGDANGTTLNTSYEFPDVVEVTENELKRKNEELVGLLQLCSQIDTTLIEKLDQETETESQEEYIPYKSQLSDLEHELKQKEKELNTVREELKEIVTNFNETRWALATEVKEKHDEISKLRASVDNLEEKLMIADMQIHLKDDVIKRMRADIKTKKEGPKLCNVVTEITQQHRKMTAEEVLSQGKVKEGAEAGASPDEPSSGTEAVSPSGSKTLSPREQVASLREVLLADIQKLHHDTLVDGVKIDVCQQKVNKLANIGGGDGADVSVSSDCSTSVSSTRVDSQATSACPLHIKPDNTAVIVNTIHVSTEDDKNFLRQNKLQQQEGCISDGNSLHLPGRNQNCVAILLQEKEQMIENLKRDLSSLKSIYEKGYSLSEKNVEYLIHLVDRLCSKLPISNQKVEPSNSSVESLEQKLLLLENAISNLCDELVAERKLALNKEETLQNLHDTVQLRENQVTAFSSKATDLEKQLEEQKDVIAALQQAVQNSKKLELKEKDQEIRSLRFDFCELEEKNLLYAKECKQLKCTLMRKNTENGILRDKITFFETFVPRIKDMQEITILYKEKSWELERSLSESQAEVAKLQSQVKKLEENVDAEVEGNEKRMRHDAKIISSLQTHISQVKKECEQAISVAKLNYISLKTSSTEQMQKLMEQIHNLLNAKEALHKKCNEMGNLLHKARSDEEEKMKEISEMKVKYEKNVDDLEEKLKSSDNHRLAAEKLREESEKVIRRLTTMLNQGKKVEAENYANWKKDQDDLHKVTTDFKKLEKNYEDLRETLERVTKEKTSLKRDRSILETEMVEVKNEYRILADKISSLIREKERNEHEYSNDILILKEKNRNAESTIGDLYFKLQEYERQIEKLQTTVKVLEVEAHHANTSCLTMRKELDKFVEIMEAKGKMEDEFRCRQENWSKTRGSGLSSCDPWQPMPPAAHALWSRQKPGMHDSTECFVESGFQSMMPSPVPMSDTASCQHHAEAEPVRIAR